MCLICKIDITILKCHTMEHFLDFKKKKKKEKSLFMPNPRFRLVGHYWHLHALGLSNVGDRRLMCTLIEFFGEWSETGLMRRNFLKK